MFQNHARSSSMIIGFFLAIGFCCADVCVAATYYVAQNGNDTTMGTKDKPFKTIQHAATIMVAGDSCIIRHGTYTETVRPSNSGTAGAMITFLSFKGEKATIAGTDLVVGWKHLVGKIYVSQVTSNLDKNNQVFFDDSMVDEARWPNRSGNDLLDLYPATIDDGGTVPNTKNAYIICHQLPNLPDNSWNGAVIWVMAGSKWTSWTSTITGYEAANKKLVFTMPGSSDMSTFHNPKDGGSFFLTNFPTAVALDTSNEWYFDTSGHKLYLWAPGGLDPGTHRVTVKKRLCAFDLSNRSYIQVSGVVVHAATMDLDSADHCVIQGIRATYISHTHGGSTSYGLNEATGIIVSGTANTIRDCEIAYSAGNGISVSGTFNRVINCWIHHTDYMGCYASAINLRGSQNLISHNTISETGRDLLQWSGAGHVIQYNEFSRCGRLANDLGFTYTAASDGGGSEIHHNWFHDNMVNGGWSFGIYFDNFTSNFIAHHNVVWGVQGAAILLNKPSNAISIFNNTIIGKIANSGRWEEDRMYGDFIANNLVTDLIEWNPDLELSSNLSTISSSVLNSKNFFNASRPGIDAGRIIPGITDGYHGKAPDLGAYEAGEKPWKAGHNFSMHPDPAYKLSVTPFKNLLVNGGFESVNLDNWEKTGAQLAKKTKDRTSILNPASSRNSIIGSSVCLSGETTDGIAQCISGLLPNTRYTFGGFVKSQDKCTLNIGVRGQGGKEISLNDTGMQWKYLSVDYTTGPTSSTDTVFIQKLGKGSAYADWFWFRQATTKTPLSIELQITRSPMLNKQGELSTGEAIFYVRNGSTVRVSTTFDIITSSGLSKHAETISLTIDPGAQQRIPIPLKIKAANLKQTSILAIYGRFDPQLFAVQPIVCGRYNHFDLLELTTHHNREQLNQTLDSVASWPIGPPQKKLADISAIKIADTLAVLLRVYDRRITKQTKQWAHSNDPWRGPTVELYAAPVGATQLRQICFFADGSDSSGSIKVFSAGKEIPTPQIDWQVVPGEQFGYTLVARIPLSILGIDPLAQRWLFDAAVFAAPTPGGAIAFDTFTGFANAFQSSLHYALVEIRGSTTGK